jgi:hypothetical protein
MVKMRKLFQTPIHVLILAIYPILALYNFNNFFLNPSLTYRSFLLSLAITAILWALLQLILKDWQVSGVITSLFLVLLFSYGHIFNLLQAQFGEIIRHRYGAVLVFAILGIGSWLIIRKRKSILEITRPLNILTLSLLVMTLITSGTNWYSSFQADLDARNSSEKLVTFGDTEITVDELPDIYYIIMDSYGRSDSIKDFTGGYDNGKFINELENIGFYVAECSQTNYSNTTQSLTSSLYVDYLDNVVSEGIALPSWEKSVVRTTLSSLGYTTYSFESRAAGHYDFEPDIYLSRNSILAGEFSIRGGINDFESLLMNTSLLRLFANIPFLTGPLSFLQNPVNSGFYEHYLQSQYILDELPNLAEVEGPKFVMAHMIVPHRPYVFTAEGDYDSSAPDAHIPGYATNVEFLDNRMGAIVQALAENSEIEPIIILQGDHGPTGEPTPEQRMPILNAYFVNEEAQSDLYAGISPVNSFRVIFNNYLGTDYPILEDTSYYLLTRGDFWNAEIVPNNCEASFVN